MALGSLQAPSKEEFSFGAGGQGGERENSIILKLLNLTLQSLDPAQRI